MEIDNNLIKSKRLEGLNIFSIKEGQKIGVVKSVLLDFNANRSPVFVIEDKQKGFKKVIEAADIAKIGKDTLVIESTDKIKLFNLKELDLNLADLKGKIAVSVDKKQGRIMDCLIDKENIDVVQFEIIDSSNEPCYWPVDQVAEIKKDAAIPGSNKEVIKEDAKKEQTQGLIEEELTSTPHLDLKQILEEQQEAFLLGKKVDRDITDSDGNPIIQKEETITKKVLEKAKKAHKFFVLGFCIKTVLKQQKS